MSAVDLIKKSETESLTQEELRSLIEHINGEMQEIKEHNPAEYLRLIKGLNNVVHDLNKELNVL
jgi:hypothetical protein